LTAEAAAHPPRSVTLVLCTRDGDVCGALPPLEVPVPWWQEVGDVVAQARAVHGLDVTVLRLLDVRTSTPADGGPVTYLAEVADAGALATVTLKDWPGDPVAEHPLRTSYARPRGPAQDLAWADDRLREHGRERIGPAEQIRTWNLSSIWRLPTEAGPVWLKVVPPFFGHEGAMLTRIAGEHPTLVPPVISVDGPRVLLADVPGGDHYDADLPMRMRMMRLLVELQVEWIDRVAELEDLGVPDWRPESLTALAQDVLTRTADALDQDTVDILDRVIADLPRRFADIGACGIPDSLVHGDFHAGNVVGTADRLALLDWGDCGIGHPLLDQTAFIERLSEADRSRVLGEWSALWGDACPGSQPDQAGALLEPVAALRQAVIYRGFLDAIEPDERIYHQADPAFWLNRAARIVDGTA
jgi:hypothetical protein